jgi:hypothetical protein
MLALIRHIKAVTISIIAKSVARALADKTIAALHSQKDSRLQDRQSDPSGDFAQHHGLPKEIAGECCG